MKNADDQPHTLAEAIRYFSDLDVATEFVATLRWPGGPVCPECGSGNYSYLSTRRLWKCKICKKQYSVKVGTLFEGSPIELDKWLVTIWMLANSKDMASTYEIHDAIGVTQKTAWSMVQRIRVAMKTETFSRLSGKVEIEESLIDYEAPNLHADNCEEKATGRRLAGEIAKSN
jgi:transposase-like protein